MKKKIAPDPEFLRFVMNERREGKKTDTWDIMSIQSGETLGEIKWYGAWRKYVFSPYPRTLFDTKCINEIKAFIELKMLERKNSLNSKVEVWVENKNRNKY